MDQLTTKERDEIEKKPLQDANGYADAQRDANLALSSELGSSDDNAVAPQHPKLFKDIIIKVLASLETSEVSFCLRSRTGRDDLGIDLRLLRQHITAHDIQYQQFRPLLLSIQRKAADTDVWCAVITVISEVLVSTPPTSVSASVSAVQPETPITRSSASREASEETRKLIEADVFYEIKYCTYRDVKGFHEKYFSGCAWTAQAKQVWERAKSRYSNNRWTLLSNAPSGDDITDWWLGMQTELLPDRRLAYYTSTQQNRVGPKTSRQLDLFVKERRGVAGADEKHDWKDVLVVGEFKKSAADGLKSILLQVASAVRNVFAAQPMRRFVHGFTLSGTMMETWVFDRSGAYSGATFDIHEQPETFMLVMCGYLMMTDEELGRDTFLKRRDGGLLITVPAEGGGTDEKLELELNPIPIAYQGAIVCRGTCCFLAKAKGATDFDKVVKFSWTSDKRQPEADLLRKANQQGVEGIAKVIAYNEEITSVSKLREGLTFSTPHRFRDDSLSKSQASFGFISPSIGLVGLNSSRKRKSTELSSQQSKRSRRHSQLAEITTVTYEVQEPRSNSIALRDEPQTTYDNRIFRALVVSPAGRSIRQFQDPKELLYALRDAIVAHRSLHRDGSILHRDISENNIIITDPAKADGLRGMLIDLDLAKEEGQGRSGARHRTGTMQFMAIEVLTGTAHTYRHDLEAFFYVLIWLCAYRAREGQQKSPLLARWHNGTYEQIAQSKRGDMDQGGLENLLQLFPENFEPIRRLCRKLRDILFPYRCGLFTGTPKDSDSLYDPIITAFNNTIADTEKSSE
ncbi:serine/threonine-protein kinase Sgk2 [Xylaria sp. FL0933]|nr:serine/threonine-protein kinase Sgk2 [Xylaria sp. FL0933]